MEGITIPNKLEKALQDPKWAETMNMEMEALQKNETWEIVKQAEGNSLGTWEIVDGYTQLSAKLMAQLTNIN